MLSSRFGPGVVSPVSAITVPPVVSMRTSKLDGAARGPPLRDKYPDGNKCGNAVARTRRGTADAQPRLRLSAQAHQFEHRAAVRRQRLGRDDLALLGLVADIRAQRPAVRRNDRKLFDRDRRERRLAQRLHVGDAAGVDATDDQLFEGGHRAGNVRLRQRIDSCRVAY